MKKDKGYPNPTFLQKARKVKTGRRKRTIVAVSIIAVLILAVSFVIRMASLEREYASKYPDLVGKATATTVTTTTESSTRKSSSETSATTTEEETTTTTTEETELRATVNSSTSESESSSGSDESTQGTTQNNEADVFEEIDNVYFKNNYPSSKISHQQRAVNLDHMKRQIDDLKKNNPDVRIGFRYLSLSSGESIGVDDLNPMVPASAFNLPLRIYLCQRMAAKTSNPDSVITYNKKPDSGSSYIADNYQPGKKFTLRSLAFYSIAYNDNFATDAVIRSFGGSENARDTIESISSYQSYWKEKIYKDYAKTEHVGKGRSTCYDMANYAKFVYTEYKNKPAVYQSLINDLSQSATDSPISKAFGPDVPVFHISGSNKTLGAYTDLAIVDSSEPLVLCIYAEASSESKAKEIMQDIAGFASSFISSCY